MGSGLTRAQSYGAVLEAMLNNGPARPESEARSFEVINFGVGGYGTIHSFVQLEEALQIKEKEAAEGTEGSVTVLTAGPERATEAIRKALSMGADKAVIIDDEALRGADALTTARALAAALREDGFDLIIAGTESTDGYAGVMPQQLAELLESLEDAIKSVSEALHHDLYQLGGEPAIYSFEAL